MDGCLSSDLTFFLNGRKVIESNPCPKTQLVEYLRERLNLKGTKIGCSEGGCGSCTVMVSKYDRKTRTIQHEARYACLTPVCTLHGTAVTTIEALGSTRTGMHKLQEYLVAGHGVQCGFCSPGMIMSMYALIRSKINPTDLDIENALKGNLCRCTGYRPILDSFKLFTKDNCPMGENCCRNNICNAPPGDMVSVPDKLSDELVKNKQELIFPSELQLSDQLDGQNLKFQNQNIIWYSPVSVELVLTYKKLFPQALIVAGVTSAVFRLKNAPVDQPLIVISLSRVNDFDSMEVSDDGITVGPNVTVSAFESYLKSHLNKLSESKMRLVVSLLEVCQRFGSVQIRNAATICGGLALGAISSDMNILLLAANCKVTVLSRACERLMNIDGGFFLSNTRVRASEIIIRLFIPFADENKYFGFFKLSPRKDFSQANLNCGFSVEFNDGPQCVVKEASFNYGGWFQKPLIMSGLAAYVRGKSWDKNMLQCCLEEVEKDFNKLKHLNLIIGSADDLDYVLFSMHALFFKFFVKVLIQLSQKYLNISKPCGEVLSAVNFSTCHDKDKHSGAQVYNSHVNNFKAASAISSPEDDSLGKPLPHRWSNQSTTGEAIFIDDQIPYQGELCLSLVTSTKARAKILKVDYSEALAQSGVVGYVDHTSVQGSNIIGLFEPQELFASEEVFYVGQIIAAIVARTHEQARSACRLVQVYYEEREPIITIEDAVIKHSYHTGFGEFSLKRGDAGKVFSGNREEILENEMSIGGQEHFYMETHCCRVVPLVEDGGEVEVFAGCQYAAGLQQILSKTLNIPENKINIRVKRMGGAFGGKEMRVWLTAAPSAVAALKFNLPVRCMLTRRQDMQITGHRRPYKAKYKVGFTREGKIKAVDLKMFSSDGWFPDINPLFMAMSVMNFDGVYSIPNFEVSGYSCKTNLPPCTAMRGAGVPQALFITESLISDVANYLGMPAHEVRESNMYTPGSLTVGNSPIDNSLHRCYLEVKRQSRFEEVLLQIKDFNRKNKYVKQAVAILPIKFSPSFSPGMNKGSALINIYNDGTVLLTHGGVESGQGLHTKMIQVASHALRIPASFIHINETATSTVPNAVTTGGSTGSDLNGMAVVDACRQIENNLKSLRTSNPDLPWKDLIQLALKNKVNLSAVGYWNGEYNENFNWKTGEGRFHTYYTYGAVVSHVEVDCTTGEHAILKVDIVMDVGKSLNPAIDVGQIEGGFVMGLGLSVLEDHRYSSNGTLETIGPGKYHIPTVGNLPLEMNVTLLKDSGNERAVYSSKGIGEPPLLLSTSVWLAIREVVAQVRMDRRKNGDDEDVKANVTEIRNVEKNRRVFQFNTPAMPKNVLLACGSKNLSC